MSVSSASVDTDVFLANQYLSLGVNAFGGLGSTKYAPTGIQVDSANGYRTVGLVADLDGFGRGKASTLHDAIMRGAPIEGFNIGYKTGGATHVESNQQLDGLTEIKGVSSNGSADGVGKALWSGATVDNLAVNQTMTLVDGAKYIKVDVVLTNNSGAAMTDVRYMRTADPDQAASTMVTTNQIVKQGAGEALVTAGADKAGGSPYFLYADDPRAVVSTYGFINEDPYAATAFDKPQAVGTKITADQSINLTFSVGSLAAGQSTTVTFYMGVTDDINATLQAIHVAGGVTTPPPVTLPNAVDDAVAAIAGQTATGNVLSNDSNPAGGALTAALKSGPAHGTLKLSPDGTFIYAAEKGYAGADSFTYTASAGGQSATATVKVTTAAPSPTVIDDKLAAIAGQTSRGNVLANDSDSGGFALSAAVKTGPAHGKLALADDGSYSYVADKGYAGADSFTYIAAGGGQSKSGTVSIATTAPTPNAVDDTVAAVANKAVSGNVLANDTDTGGFALSATLKGGPSHGSVTLASDGSFTYTAEKNFVGADSFSYTASGGGQSDVATVRVVTAPALPFPGLPVTPTLQRAGTIDGSQVTGATFTGDKGTNSFYFDLQHATGKDHITDFGGNDVLVTNGALYDGNGDGQVTFSRHSLKLIGSTDLLALDGVSALRSLGTDAAGLNVYAAATSRPIGSIEGKLGNDVLSGDAGDRKTDKFFFDTGLGLDLGVDQVAKFGVKDVLITTSALGSQAPGDTLALSGGLVKLGGGDLGSVHLTNGSGADVAALDFEGTAVRGDVTYYVYATHGSAATVHTAGF